MESEVSFESALQNLKSMFDCPTEDGHPVKGTWCGDCREICDADGTNWCDRNRYLGSVLTVEAAHESEIASLRAKRNELYDCNLKLRSLVRVLADVLDDNPCFNCASCGEPCERCSDRENVCELVAKAREVCHA